MGKMNLLTGKGFLLGIFALLMLIVLIPLVLILSHSKQNPANIQEAPTETPTVLSFSNAKGSIAGYVYHDTNQNGERETDEKPFKDVSVQMQMLKENDENGKISEAQTDSSGYFKFNFYFSSSDKLSYMIKIVLPKN